MPKKTKKVIYIVSFCILVISFISLLIFTIDSKKIKEIEEFIKADVKILYVTPVKKNNYITKILEKYDIEYMNIESSKLSVFELKKLEEITNNRNLNNILVIYKNGKFVKSLTKYKKIDVEKFLQNNEIIPDKIVDGIDKIMNSANEILEGSYSMIYIPYENNEYVDSQDKIFDSISRKYNIEYKRIDAYLLSNTQKQKINNLLGISFVENQILILVKDKKNIANIRGIHSKNTYIESLYEVNFINELENRINEIDFNDFKEELRSENKSIILIGSNQIKDSNEVFNLLNQMIYNYNIEVNYIDVEDETTKIYNNVKEKLEDIGYEGGFSLPMVVIVESNNILDYAIGNSKEEYFIDIFIENGVIKGDAINE